MKEQQIDVVWLSTLQLLKYIYEQEDLSLHVAHTDEVEGGGLGGGAGSLVASFVPWKQQSGPPEFDSGSH